MKTFKIVIFTFIGLLFVFCVLYFSRARRTTINISNGMIEQEFLIFGFNGIVFRTDRNDAIFNEINKITGIKLSTNEKKIVFGVSYVNNFISFHEDGQGGRCAEVMRVIIFLARTNRFDIAQDLYNELQNCYVGNGRPGPTFEELYQKARKIRDNSFNQFINHFDERP